MYFVAFRLFRALHVTFNQYGESLRLFTFSTTSARTCYPAERVCPTPQMRRPSKYSRVSDLTAFRICL